MMTIVVLCRIHCAIERTMRIHRYLVYDASQQHQHNYNEEHCQSLSARNSYNHFDKRKMSLLQVSAYDGLPSIMKIMRDRKRRGGERGRIVSVARGVTTSHFEELESTNFSSMSCLT